MLDRNPVVAATEPVVDGRIEAAGVVEDRGLRDPKSRRNLALAEARLQELAHCGPRNAWRVPRRSPLSAFHERMFPYRVDGTTSAEGGECALPRRLFEPETLGIQGSNLGFQDQNLAGFRYPNPQEGNER
jgi:hypothetical protein